MDANKQKAWRDFVRMNLKIKAPRQFEEFARFIFTAEERNQLAMRVLLTRELLKEKRTQREIAEDFKVSIAKITRGSNNIKHISAKLRKFLETHLK